MRRRAERLHEVERQHDLAAARAVHEAIGDAHHVAEHGELLVGDRPGHAEHRLAGVQRRGDRGRQAVGGLPFLGHRPELALDVLRRLERVLAILAFLARGEGAEQHVVLHREHLAAVAGDGHRGEREEVVGELEHLGGVEHLREAREVAQLGVEQRRLAAFGLGHVSAGAR